MTPHSYLFVPGDRPDRFAKALATGAGSVVIDLEDAVSVDHKARARESAAQALQSGETFSLRINGRDTPWFDEDCRLLRLPGLSAVVLPKAESAEALEALRACSGKGTPLIPLIETARGLAAARALAACPQVQRLAFGSVDFQLDTDIEGDGDELLLARCELVLASRLAQVASPIDGVTLAVTDTARTHEDALRARKLGFGAKLCIHPAQVAPVEQAFATDEASRRWARAVLEAIDTTPAGAITVDGRLVDKPVMDRARRILARGG